jgi:group I intron endonuclease
MIIYSARNKLNGKIYIGQTIQSLKNRKKQHKSEANIKRRLNNHFHNAIRKYGIEAFEWIVLKKCNNLGELNFWEKYYINQYKSNDKFSGYNSTDGGRTFEINDEVRKRLSASARKRCSSEQHIQKFIKLMNSAEVIAKKKKTMENITSKGLRKGDKNSNYKKLDEKLIESLFNSNISIEEIALKLNVASETVSRRIRAINLKRKRRARPETILLFRTKTGDKNNNWNKEISNDAIAELFKKGHTAWKISKELGYPRTTVQRRIKLINEIESQHEKASA